ncbi:MAG: efflux RND transporter permease subunit [Pseudonocardiales bacterium]|nr:efflux RND transporter permease subunit [Pseudonocardiales bacterium]
MTRLARLSLANRAIIGVVTVLFVVFGVISTTALRQELLPSLDVPVATVVTAYPGVSPEVVEQQVTMPIEAAVGGITGVTGTHSTSTGGSSIVVIDLEHGSDLAALSSQFQRAVQGVSLPDGVTAKVVTGSTDTLPVVQLAVSSNLDADRVAAVLRDQVRPLLGGLDGVADVTLSGIRDPQITIDVDTAAAAAHGASLNSVMTLLQANGVRLPAGQLTPDTNPLTVEVGSPITSVDALKDLYLTPAIGPTGSTAGAPASGSRIHPSAMLVPRQAPGRVTALPSVAAPSDGAQPHSTPAPSPSPRPSGMSTPTSSAAAAPTGGAQPAPKAGSSASPRAAVPSGTGTAPRAPVSPGGRVKPPAVLTPRTGAASTTPVRLGDIATITAAPAPATGYRGDQKGAGQYRRGVR